MLVGVLCCAFYYIVVYFFIHNRILGRSVYICLVCGLSPDHSLLIWNAPHQYTRTEREWEKERHRHTGTYRVYFVLTFCVDDWAWSRKGKRNKRERTHWIASKRVDQFDCGRDMNNTVASMYICICVGCAVDILRLQMNNIPYNFLFRVTFLYWMVYGEQFADWNVRCACDKFNWMYWPFKLCLPYYLSMVYVGTNSIKHIAISNIYIFFPFQIK